MRPGDPLAGVGGPPPVDAGGAPFCPVCGLDLRGGVCPACDPARPTTAAARAARRRAQERVAVRVAVVAAARSGIRNPWLWLCTAVVAAIEPAAVVGAGLVLGYIALWVWVAGVADR